MNRWISYKNEHLKNLSLSDPHKTVTIMCDNSNLYIILLKQFNQWPWWHSCVFNMKYCVVVKGKLHVVFSKECKSLSVSFQISNWDWFYTGDLLMASCFKWLKNNQVLAWIGLQFLLNIWSFVRQSGTWCLCDSYEVLNHINLVFFHFSVFL